MTKQDRKYLLYVVWGALIVVFLISKHPQSILEGVGLTIIGIVYPVFIIVFVGSILAALSPIFITLFEGSWKDVAIRFSWIAAAGLLILGFTFAPRIGEGFTSAEKLADRCYETSVIRTRIGAVCWDGTYSSATGRGACSWHDGVNRWRYRETKTKSYSECLRRAKEISWID